MVWKIPLKVTFMENANSLGACQSSLSILQIFLSDQKLYLEVNFFGKWY